MPKPNIGLFGFHLKIKQLPVLGIEFEAESQKWALSLSFKMYWNYIVWCCFHWEECKRQKHSTKENLLCHIFTMGALWSIIQTDLGTTVKSYNFCFFSFLKIGHVTNLPTTHGTLTHKIIMILYFLTFWSYIFLTFWLYISFWFSGYNVLVTIFGNVHRPCRYYFIILNNSLYHVYSFFAHFLALFTSVTILENVHRPCKQCINIIKKSLHHVYSFSSDFSWSCYDICMNYHIRQCTQTM